MGCEEYGELITASLYDEVTDVEARRLATHLERCSECRSEAEALREVRQALSTWHAPSFAKPRPAWAPPVFFWGFAAAATLVVGMGVGLGMSGLELRIGREPLVVSLGRPAAVADTAVASAAPEETSVATAQQEAAPPIVLPAAVTSSEQQAACVKQAEALLAASEARQSAAMQASMSDLERRLVAQRQYDLARISAGLSYLEGKTGQDMARTTELMGQILRVSGGSER